ncbi:unnamed protein product, partial [Dicrocoelium dendriticum]
PNFVRKDVLTLVNDCLILAICIVILKNLRVIVIQMLHASHQGMTRMKSLARCYACWPNIDKDIVGVVRSYSKW